MNKLTLTRRGIQFLNEEKQEIQSIKTPSMPSFSRAQRTSSLPQLISSAHLLQKNEVTNQLSRMTLRLKDLKQKGLKRMFIDEEDEHFTRKMQEQMEGRKKYLKEIVVALARKTRDNHRFGNLQSRLERGRAYINRLQHNFDKKFVFHPPKKIDD